MGRRNSTSAEAYANTGPSTRLNGMPPVHGRVQMVASSTVNSQTTRSGPVRVKRSIRCRLAPDPRKLVLSEKLVVSTTSVSPSQCPRESPFHT